MDAIARIDLDVSQAGSQKTIEASQHDTNRELRIRLTNGSAPYHIPPNSHAVFCARKPDGTKLTNGCDITGDEIVYAFTPQTAVSPGYLRCEIRLYSFDEKLLTAPRFTLSVHETVSQPADVPESAPEWTELDKLIFQVLQILNRIEGLSGGGTIYGCATAAGEAEKVVDMQGETVAPGSRLMVRFVHGSTVETATLSAGGKTAPILPNPADAGSAPSVTGEIPENYVVELIAAESFWLWLNPADGGREVAIDGDPITDDTKIHVDTAAPEVNIDVPTELAELHTDDSHQTVSQAEKDKWNKGVSQAYVDERDIATLDSAKTYADSKLVTIEVENRGENNFWTRPVTTANEIIDMVNAGKEVRLSFYDTITDTGDQLYPYENTRNSVCYFRRNIITEEKISRISWGVQFDGSIVATEIPYAPPLMTAYAVCHDPAAPPSSTANTWYIPKTMPKPSGNVGMMIDVFWEHGLNGLGYNASLIWGEPGSADNETIVAGASVTDNLTGEHSIPTKGTVRYQLEESSGRPRWRYVSGDLIPTEFSTATAAATADKTVPGLALGYLPGMEIYVQMDEGNTANLMRLVPDEGETLPVYGNGTGANTGNIPKGYILHLKNAGDHWQIINQVSEGGSGLPAISPGDDGKVPTVEGGGYVLKDPPSGGAGIFVASYGSTTLDQIRSAVNSGQDVICADGVGRYHLVTLTGTYAEFARTIYPFTENSDRSGMYTQYIRVSDHWFKLPLVRMYEANAMTDGAHYYPSCELVRKYVEDNKPKPLTFTGAANATYDGTKPVTVPIPTGGGVSPEDRKKWDAGAEELAVGDAPDTDSTKAHLADGGEVRIPETATDITATVPAGLPPETPQTAQGVLDALAKKEGGVDSRTPIKQMVATTATLDPDTEYIWGEVASLTLDFAPVPYDGFSHDYIWEFQSGASPTTLNLPESVKWAGGAAPEIESGKTYQMMLHNGGVYYAEF